MGNTVSSIFSEDFLQGLADATPVEGSGLQRTYELTVVNAYFQEASAKYQAKVKAGEGKVLQAVFEGVNEDGDKREEKYTIGKGYELEGSDGGKTAPRVKSTAGYATFSRSSLYGRLCHALQSVWGVTPENEEECRFATPNGEEIIIGPEGQRFFKWLVSQNKKPDWTNIENFIGVKFQMDKDEYESDGKPQDRAFPFGLLALEGEIDETQASKPDPKEKAAEAKKAADAKAAAVKKAADAKKAKESKEAEPEADTEAEVADAPEEKAASKAAAKAEPDAGGRTNDDILADLMDLALAHDKYNDFRGPALKLDGVKGVNPWMKWVLDTANYAKLKTGEATAP